MAVLQRPIIWSRAVDFASLVSWNKNNPEAFQDFSVKSMDISGNHTVVLK